MIGLILTQGCKSNQKNDLNLNHINAEPRDIYDKPLEFINTFVEIPVPSRPVLELLDENSHLASKQNIEILWNNFLIS